MKSGLSSMKKPTLHIIGIFYTICNHNFDVCAFTAKVIKFSKMMQNQGYETIEYSNGESISGANEQVQMLTEHELTTYINNFGSGYYMNLYRDYGLAATFENLLIPEMQKRVKPGDIICYPYGPVHTNVFSMFPLCHHVEIGVGYPAMKFGPLRIFESYAWMHYHKGLEKGEIPLFDRGEALGSFYDFVIPNFYDTSEWEVSYDKGGYLLYFGRICELKGLVAIRDISEKLKETIQIWGPGYPEQFSGKYIEAHPPTKTQQERNDVLKNARAIIIPSYFLETFCSAAVEAMLCGTPVICPDYGAFTETVEQGKTGFRCHTFGDFLAAIDKIETLDREYIANRTRELYSIDTVGKQYDAAFKQISDLNNKGWYTEESYSIK